jgi:hypothetical protein
LAQLPETHYQGVGGLFEFDDIGDLKMPPSAFIKSKTTKSNWLILLNKWCSL